MHNYTWENTNMAGDWGRHLTILSSPSSHLSVTSKSLVWFPKAWSVFCFWVPLHSPSFKAIPGKYGARCSLPQDPLSAD